MMRSTTTKTDEGTRWSVILVVVLFVAFVVPCTAGSAQDVTDAQLAAASGGRTVRLGPASGAGPVDGRAARGLRRARAGGRGGAEGAPDGEFQALAIAIRTYALVNAGRHARDGFDVCDSTHCQVPRAANALTRAAALATAGQILTWNGAPAEVFYSASCGGHSESPRAGLARRRLSLHAVGARRRARRGRAVDVRADAARTRSGSSRALGFEGRLRDVDVDERNASGRATRLRLSGMQPDVIAGDQFRLAVGAARRAQHGVFRRAARIDAALHRARLRPRRRHVRDRRRPPGRARRGCSRDPGALLSGPGDHAVATATARRLSGGPAGLAGARQARFRARASGSVAEHRRRRAAGIIDRRMPTSCG